MEDESVVVNKEEEEEEEMVDLPPGFRFHPTDEEIITHYLTPKVVNTTFVSTAIGEVDINKCEPWDLPKRAKMGEKEWYFFCQRDNKYPTGTRTNRATESGYWKATGKDKEIFKSGNNKNGGGCLALVGMKKTLVFYRGRAPKGHKTNWVMHEFRLHPNFSYYNHLPNPKVVVANAKDDWVVCRVFHKSSGINKAASNLMDNLFNCCSSSPSSSPPPPLVDPARPSLSFCTHHQSESGFNEEEDDDDDINYYPSLDHHQPLIYNNSYDNNSNAYQMIMNQFSSCPKPVIFPSSFLQGGRGLMVPMPQSCKGDHFSSNHGSTVITRSHQDTGLSTDVNNNTTDVTSSKLHNDNNNKIEEIPDVADIDCLWDF